MARGGRAAWILGGGLLLAAVAALLLAARGVSSETHALAARVIRALGPDDWAEAPLRAIAAREPGDADEERLLVEALTDLAQISWRRERTEEAEALLRRALALETQLAGEPSSGRLELLAGMLRDGHRHAEAASLYEEALALSQRGGATDLGVARILDALAGVRMDQGRLEEAASLFRRSLSIREELSPAGDPDMADALFGLGRLHGSQGRYAMAELYLSRALEHLEDEPRFRLPLRRGGGRPETRVRALVELAAVYIHLERFDHAESTLARALPLTAASGEVFARSRTLRLMASLEARRGDGRKADERLQQALAELPASMQRHLLRAELLMDLAVLRQGARRHEEAETLLAEVEDILRAHGRDGDPSLGPGLARLAQLRSTSVLDPALAR